MSLHFNEKQKKAWNLLTRDSKTRFLFDGGSRSGKTSLICEYLIRRALQYPGSRQLAARKHKAHAKASLWNDTLKGYLFKHLPDTLYQLHESECVIRFRNRSEIIVGGLDDSSRTEKVLGNEYITVFLNESTQLSYETVQMAITRLAQRAVDRYGHEAVPKLILDCNPRGPRHWLHYVGVRHVDPESEKALPDADRWVRLNWSAYDNKENLPAAYLASLEALPEIMKERMLNGVWRDNAGSVYSEFDEDLHCVDPFPLPKDWRRFRAIDFGFTNPFACLWGAEDPDGRIYIYREWVRAQMRTLEHCRKIKELSASEDYAFTVADHDASERAELNECGIRNRPANKDVMKGIQIVKNRLVKAGDGRPRLYFFKNLKALLGEIYEYRWAPSASGRNLPEEPLKLNDHCMDALRYMLVAADQLRGGNLKLATPDRAQEKRTL